MRLDVDLSLLLQAVKTMRAGQIDFNISNDFVPITPIDKQLNEGLEVNFQDIELSYS